MQGVRTPLPWDDLRLSFLWGSSYLFTFPRDNILSLYFRLSGLVAVFRIACSWWSAVFRVCSYFLFRKVGDKTRCNWFLYGQTCFSSRKNKNLREMSQEGHLLKLFRLLCTKLPGYIHWKIQLITRCRSPLLLVDDMTFSLDPALQMQLDRNIL